MKFENIVIGKSLEAMLYSYYNEYPIIINSLHRPFRFDRLSKEIELCENKTDNKLSLWSAAAFELSLKGLSPFGPSIASARIEGSEVTIVTEPATNIKVQFEKCYLFDDDNLLAENEVLEEPSDMCRVFDWMNVRRGTTHKFDYLVTRDKFIQQIYFYKSERIDGAHNKKDLVAVSYLKQKDLQSFDYSDTMARFKIQSIMSEKGIIGSRSGLSPAGQQRKYNVKVEPDYRSVEPVDKRIYKDSENVKFMKMTAEEIVAEYAG